MDFDHRLNISQVKDHRQKLQTSFERGFHTPYEKILDFSGYLANSIIWLSLMISTCYQSLMAGEGGFSLIAAISISIDKQHRMKATLSEINIRN